MFKSYRLKLFFYWIVGCIFASLVGTIPSVIYWKHVYVSSNIDVVGEVLAMTTVLPIGWLLSFLMPWGWVSLACFSWAVKANSVKPLLGAYAVSFVFGVHWPNSYWTMMSV